MTPQLPPLLDRDNLLQEAQDADFDLDSAAASTDENNQAGWLRGIPLAIKDLEKAKGLPTTSGGCPLFGVQTEQGEDEGSYRFGDWKFENEMEDEPFVRRLRDAGAIIIGKTNGKDPNLIVLINNELHSER